MKCKILLLQASCLLLFCNTNLSAQQPSTKEFAARLDSFITTIMKQLPDVPGLSVAIVVNDKPIFLKAYGYADKEAGIVCKTNTPFYIASSTKSFTALAAALLDEEGKIKLDAPLQNYFPAIKFKNDIPANKITMQQLLSHTSGLENDVLTFRVAYSGDIEKAEIKKVFEDLTTTNANYGKFNYDNLGYNIYALALENYLHINWQDLLQEKIFAPLGLKRTTAFMSLAKKNNWELAKPYDAFGINGLTKLYLEKQDNTMQSAGGLITTAEDAALWLTAQINNGKINGKQLIPAAAFEKCRQSYATTTRQTPPFTGDAEYGLGWYTGKWKDEKVTYHFGGFPGFYTHISYMPDSKIGIAILVNESSIGSKVADLIATYSYDQLLQKNITGYNTLLQKLVETHAANKIKIAKVYEDRAKRTSQLSLPLEKYTGVYKNPYFGNVAITIQDNVLAVRIGNLHCVSTNFTKAESIRVELVPGTGTPLYFKKNSNDSIDKVVYEDAEFIKQ